MLCARCRTELGVAAGAIPQISTAPVTAEAERDARELLARWSANNLLDSPSSVASAGSFAKSKTSTGLTGSNSDLRFDLPRSSVPSPSDPFLAAMNESSNSALVLPLNGRDEFSTPPRLGENGSASRAAESTVPAGQMQHQQPQDPRTAEPHSGLTHDYVPHDALPHPPRPRSTWSAVAGQLCAYSGVALLTCGTVLAMWSYFGGPPQYLPTGWLTAAIGQMLLFLGVVTLISSGMEQTISEVAWRIDYLAEEVHHMGLALDDLENAYLQTQHSRQPSDRRHTDDNQRREAA